MIANSTPRPRHCRRDSEYPAASPNVSVPASTPTVKTREVSRELSRFSRELMYVKCCSVHTTVGNRSDGEDVGLTWNAPTAMNQNGNTKAIAKTTSTA